MARTKRATDRSKRRTKAPSGGRTGDLNLDFTQSPTTWAFLNDDSFVRMIMGPVGSGKSYACCAEIFLRALKQEPNRDGIRKTRFAIVRNSYPELRTTTIKTWQELFPEDQFGPMRWSPPITHHIQLPPRDGAPGVDCEVLFLALDNPRDTRRVLSLELTGAFIDECREIPKAIASAITARVGRFPSASDVECTWRGLWMCTNPPDSDHWIHDTFVKEKPGRGKYAWKFFRQPGGMIEGDASDPQATLAVGRHWVPNPNAENINNLIPGYYDQQLGGKGLDWIKCYVGGEFVYVQEGRSVWEEYVDTTMSADHIDIDMKLPIIVGLDFGLTPAATFGQRLPSGRWNVLFEIVSKDMGLERFGQHLLYELNTRFKDLEPQVYGDPAGSKRDEIFEVTSFDYLRTLGLNAQPTASNDFQVRRESGAAPMLRFIDGKPGLQVSAQCPQLRKALSGGYHFKRVAIGGGNDRFTDKPVKNDSSHIGDAYGYMCMSSEHRRLTRGNRPGIRFEPVTAQTDFNVF